MNTEEIEIAYAIKNAVEKIEDIPNNLQLFYRAIDLITNKMISDKNYDFPVNISQFIKFIKNNNMNTYISDKLPSEPFINSFFEINENVLDFTNEKNSEEKSQKIMKELVDLCRLKKKENKDDSINWDEIYRQARLFIANNFLIKKSDLDKELDDKFGSDVAEKIKDMYEKSNYKKGEIIICPVCEKPLDFTNEKDGCNYVCKYYKKIDKLQNKKKTISGNDKLCNLKNGIYRYILIPQISENRIYKNLKERYKSLEVVLYPNIDEYDVSISNGDICINLDIKDHRTPFVLVKNLKENTNLSKLRDRYCYLVIPDHRVCIYKETEGGRYMNELIQLLQQEEMYLNVIQEKNLKKKIEEILGGIYE